MSLDISAVNTAQYIHPVIASQVKEPIAPKAVQPKTDLMQSEPPVSIQAALNELSEVSAAFNKRLSFSLNEKLGMVVVKVIDTETDKVIREIPAAEVQHVHERIREVIGILFDERA
jgi:flagellar protein FlaG